MPDDDKWLESLKALEQRWAQESAPVTDVRAFVSSILKSHNLSNDAINKRYLPVLLEEIAFEGITDSAGIAKIVVAEIKTREKRIRDSAPFKSKPEPDNLDDWFPRGEKMSTNPSPTESVNPDGDAPIYTAHWSQDPDKVAKFWLSADKVHKVRNISLPVRPQLEAFMLKTYGSTELSSLPIGMKGAELLAEYGKYLDSLEKKDEVRETTAPVAPPPPPPAPPKPRPQNAPTNYAPLSADEVRRKYTADLKGKQYLQVAGRILLFRADHPIDTGWAIKTTIMNATDTAVVFLAEIANPEGVVVASGHGRAVATQAGNYGGRIFEKAETAAIGRALANAGYGTDEVDETESPDHLADSPVNPR